MKVDIHLKTWGNEEIVLTEKVLDIGDVRVYASENGMCYLAEKTDEGWNYKCAEWFEQRFIQEILTLRNYINRIME